MFAGIHAQYLHEPSFTAGITALRVKFHLYNRTVDRHLICIAVVAIAFEFVVWDFVKIDPAYRFQHSSGQDF